MRKTIYTFLLALPLIAVQPSWATEDYGSAWTEQQSTATASETACPAPQANTATPDDSPGPQNMVEYAGG